MFQIHPLGILSLAAVLMSWGLAVVLFRTGLPGSVGRRLAVVLIFEGMTLGSSGALTGYWLSSPDELFMQHPRVGLVVSAIHFFGDLGMLVLYPPFLAAALRTKLVRPFGKKGVRVVLLMTAILIYAAVFSTPEEFGIASLYLAMAAVFLFAMVAAIHAWHLATGIERTRALIFALAFGFRDLCWTYVYSVALISIWADLPERPPDDPFWLVHSSAYIFGTLVAVPLIAYGILRTQLFDIDLRIRWTIKQSTVAAAILSIVFLVSEGASQFLSAELGNVAGLLAAAVVMFFLAPLQRFAERVASAAMPNTENTPEYTAFRKMQVYEAAVIEAQEGGGISEKERALLNRLRDSLGICESDARSIEHQLNSQVSGLVQVPGT